MEKDKTGKKMRKASTESVPPPDNSFGTAAYGGDGWSPRVLAHHEELGSIWAECGIGNEWQQLKSVLVFRPGDEMNLAEEDVALNQFAERIDLPKAQAEHDFMVHIYRENNVNVHLLETYKGVTPNQLYCADLFAMTPQGAILARPASTVRAGEERWIARKLGLLGIPVIKTLTGKATFEGADLMWIDSNLAVIGRGLRTNQQGIDQIRTLLSETGVMLCEFDMPVGTMHFMGMLRVVDKDLAFIWPGRTPYGLVSALEKRGITVLPLPDIYEAMTNMAFNFVVLGPKKIMLADKNPNTRKYYESKGIDCIIVEIDELKKANGAMGCLTGILHRKMAID